MPTPTGEEIREEALRLFYQSNPSATTPEDDELKEDGYWNLAQQNLMRGEETTETLAYLEQLANDVGRRVVTEAEHNKLLDLERKLDLVKEREKKVAVIKAHLEALKTQLDEKPQPQVIERIIQIIKEKPAKKEREGEERRIRKVQPFKVRKALPELPSIPEFPEFPSF
ncbi:hypothetical protein MUP01_10980 [Candidatus Bathyarchaeota archaeon]|nr:hypothetical protein [Candidatus Bathyarchaeota archaeon]